MCSVRRMPGAIWTTKQKGQRLLQRRGAVSKGGGGNSRAKGGNESAGFFFQKGGMFYGQLGLIVSLVARARSAYTPRRSGGSSAARRYIASSVILRSHSRGTLPSGR